MADVTSGISEKLDKDTITHVLSLLDMPNDLAHVSCVCHSWRRYVIEANLWKKLCIKLFPEIGREFKCFSNGNCSEERSLKEIDGANQSEHLEARSSVYGLLLRRLQSPPLRKTCICEPLHASSTDHLPEESVAHTLYPKSIYPDEETPSYWSSKGQSSSNVPETLTYRLVSDLCIVHNIKIQPFLVYFQPGAFIFSSEMVRFRFGYSRSAIPRWSGLFDCLCNMPQTVNMDDYVWTYVSPTFPMAQEDTLQTFELPKPTLCIGGIVQIELMGRIQAHVVDGLYYIGISHVHVTGRPLPDFKFGGIDNEGEFVFKHLCKSDKSNPATQTHTSSALEHNFVGPGSLFIEQMRSRRLALRNRIVLRTLLQNLLAAGLLSHDEDEDSENDQAHQGS